jgi:hypothetical protein
VIIPLAREITTDRTRQADHAPGGVRLGRDDEPAPGRLREPVEDLDRRVQISALDAVDRARRRAGRVGM